ncbi:hypothetical protein Q0590_00045 [Rhodocytophaga aerolata]|uniref:Uncharacterized protein n=1 Tax=Rhodocytophaga aerolata TaxID=455078 RepID=A0ABT8QXP1_9BACT|nr:hypothetical protein [Rhodocytophaga aerolata]MDO1444614.1 hypothetical protein [Rhodocytophaga aerolata]
MERFPYMLLRLSIKYYLQKIISRELFLGKKAIILSFPLFLYNSLFFSLYAQELHLTTPLSSQFECNSSSITNWDTITNYYYGVASTGFIGLDEKIGLCQAKADEGGPWTPVDGYKRTLCGYLSIKSRPIRVNTDGDIDLYVIPDPPFRWLQFNSRRPRGHVYDAYSLCCEVALNEPGGDKSNNGVAFLKTIPRHILQFNNVGVYGPWVSDNGHENSPEIHPIQQMWRTTKNPNGDIDYFLYCFLDNSGRYNQISDFSPQNCIPTPWVTIPLVNVFYIPFEIKLNEANSYNYVLEFQSGRNINYQPPLADQLRLIVNNTVRITANKTTSNLPDNPTNQQFPIITFYDICQVDNNTIRGYLAVEVSIGKQTSNTGAHAFFKITKMKINGPRVEGTTTK